MTQNSDHGNNPTQNMRGERVVLRTQPGACRLGRRVGGAGKGRVRVAQGGGEARCRGGEAVGRCGLRPAGSECCGCDGQIHTDCRVLGRKGSLSERGRGPRLDGLLLLFWAHDIEAGPYYAQVRIRWLPFTGKKVGNCFKEKNVAHQGKVVELVTLHTWEA